MHPLIILAICMLLFYIYVGSVVRGWLAEWRAERQEAERRQAERFAEIGRTPLLERLDDPVADSEPIKQKARLGD